ncbi:ABC transporter substrate-binding protein [Trichlorobacter lovleyi]|uniref:Extracellular ligand-binding receptor n=1 Tax=Trichlorobacter lovleyi (strain ATCC BAA-1151 / DSM 17278 / SZ) TaxID=398767 RepID=B3E1S6_TRIL1|nr:ABC transporter substrate-binding protein [Trichlorobacter lovleyi]ACD95576.1 Extracellular ligand-binding receptor [Trichlorobacter lovleyi SZ]
MKKLVMVCSLAAMLLCSATMALAAGTIKIGGLFSVTGPASFLGEPEKKTLEMLVADLNAKGGINGQKLEAVIYDTAGDATKAVQLATKLIKNDKVVAIIGPSTTGESMAVLALTEKEKIPLISCAAGIKITEPAKDRKFTFKTPANDHVAVEKILQYAARVKQKNLAILTVTDGFGASGREQLKVSAAQKGFKVVADETYGPKDTDMTPQLTKIRSSKADAIICWGTNPGPAIITKNIKQLGIKTPVYMSHGVASKKYIELASPAAAEGIMLPAGKLAVYDVLPKNDPQQKLLREYDAAYKKTHGVEASTFGGYAYDAFLLVTNAIRTKGATPAQIRDGLEQTKKLVSVSGVFNMSANDHNGLDLSAFEMVKIHKGDWSILK